MAVITLKQIAYLKNNYLDPAEIDEAEIDQSLSLTENLKLLKDKYSHVDWPCSQKRRRAELDSYDARAKVWAAENATEGVAEFTNANPALIPSGNVDLIDELIQRMYKDPDVIVNEEAKYFPALAELKTTNELKYKRTLTRISEKAKIGKKTIDRAVDKYMPEIDGSTSLIEDDEFYQEDNPEVLRIVDYVMNNGDPVEFIISIYNKYHKGDTNLGKVLLLSVANQSIINSEGIQPKLSGTSGKGKTHAAKTIRSLMPQEWILEGSLSAKALFQSPDLKPGTLVFSDDVRMSLDLEDTLKRSMSNFQQKTIHRTLDGNRKYQELEIPERVCWWMTAVNSNYSDELINRLFDLGVDESPKLDKDVAEQQLTQAATGELALPIDEDVEVRACREIIRQIKGQLFKVIIPYATEIEWNGESDRRNLPRFLSLIMGFTVLRHRQRLEGCDNEYVSSLQDFYDAVEIYTDREENLKTKLTDTELRFVKWAAGKGELTINDIVVQYPKLDGSKYTYEAIRKMICGSGERKGLKEKLPGLIEVPKTNSERAYVIPPLEVLEKTSSLVSLKSGAEEFFRDLVR